MRMEEIEVGDFFVILADNWEKGRRRIFMTFFVLPDLI